MRLYCIPNLEELEGYEKIAQEYGLAYEYNDFFPPLIIVDTNKKTEIIEMYKRENRDRSKDTLHGAFLDVTVHSDDPAIYEISKQRVYESMDIAMELGVQAVIFHTNYIANFRLKPYQDQWIERNELFWRATLEKYPELQIYMENMFDESPDLLQRLAIRMADEKRFGVCLDFAHAYLSGTKLDDWVDKLGKYIKHIHINDCDGVADLHFPIGKGVIPWDKYGSYLEKLPKDISVLIEVRCLADLEESLRYMQNNGMLEN